jgi:hypothetical protein
LGGRDQEDNIKGQLGQKVCETPSQQNKLLLVVVVVVMMMVICACHLSL